MPHQISVNSGQVKVCRARGNLRAGAIGSCVVVAAYDPQSRVAAMAHVMLPGNGETAPEERGLRYAQPAVKELLRRAAALGADLKRLQTCVVGGANVNGDGAGGPGLSIAQSVKEALAAQDIVPVADHLGGEKRRSCTLNGKDGRVLVTVGGSVSWTLWSARQRSDAGMSGPPEAAQSALQTSPARDARCERQVRCEQRQEHKEDLAASKRQLSAANEKLLASNKQMAGTQKELRASSQQLQATEQQLRSSNQQLHATEEQLRASNQELRNANAQLRATEQQLRASNQQLTAANRQLRATEIELRVREKQFRHTFEQAAVGIAHVAPDGRFLRANRKLCEMLLYDRDELLRHRFQNITHLEDVDVDLEQVRRLIAREVPYYNLCKRCTRKDGTMIWIELTVSLVRTPADRPDYLVCIVQDITERRRAQVALEESERKYRGYITHSPAAMFVVNENGRCIDANAAGAKLLGYEQDELRGLTLADADASDDTDLLRSFGELRRTGRVEREHVLRRKDGEIVHVNTVSVALDAHRYLAFCLDITERKRAQQQVESLARFPRENPYPVLRISPEGDLLFANPAAQRLLVSDAESSGASAPAAWRGGVEQALSTNTVASREFADGERTFCIHFVPVPGEDYVNAYGFDVTEQKRLERQFAQSQKMEAVGHLAGGVAHDFRNQLTIIKGFAEILLQRGKLPEEARSRMEQILEAADRSSHLTSQLLAFSRQDVLRPEFMNVDDMLRSLQKSFLKVLGEDIRFSVHTEGEGLCVKVDPVQLNQALLNLAINARDAMPHGGELIIRAEREELGYDFVRPYEDRRPGPYVMLSVSDTGCGMDAETCRRAFEPFFTSKEVGKGTGLGLAMVYGFVTQSGGIVTCESEPGEGTTFRMYFPAADARECCPKQDEQREPLRRGGGTVLVVEDEESVRRMMVETLREAGFDVLHAAHPHAAMIMAWENREFLDVLVTDMIMPAMTGLELASRTHVQCPRAKVLYVSGYVGEELVRRGVEVPREQLLQKPFTPNDLIDRVAGMVEQAED